MTTLTYVVQVQGLKSGAPAWKDASEHASENEAENQLAHFRKDLGEVLGPWRLVRRTEEVLSD